MLPTLSHLSVSTRPGSRLRHWCSSQYLRISPLHWEFRYPLRDSSSAVSMAVPRLSRGISRPTCQAAYVPFTPNNSEQRSPPPYYRGCWHGVSRGFLQRYRQPYSLFICTDFVPLDRSLRPEGLRPPRGVAASGFRPLRKIPHCCSRRSLDRVSVPVWPNTLSGRLPIVALVGRYPTNKLMGRGPLRWRLLTCRGKL